MSSPHPVARTSHFKRFASGLDHQARSAKDATHLLLSGGLRRFAPSEEDAVLQMLAKDIDDNTPNYVVEMRTPVFRFCVDLDFVAPEGVSLRQCIQYVAVVQGVMEECCRTMVDAREDSTTTPVDLTCVILHAEPKSVTKTVTIDTKTMEAYTCTSGRSEHTQETLVKSGYHVVWPYVYVDREKAITLRYCILEKLGSVYKNYGKKEIRYEQHSNRSFETTTMTFGTWDDVLDLAIYTANGLRMPGSHKASRCGACKNRNTTNRDEREDCDACGSMRYVDDGRPYGIAAVLRGQTYDKDETRRLVHHALDALRLTSIRCTRGEEAIPVRVPEWFSLRSDLNNCLDKVLGRRVGEKRKWDDRTFINNDDWGTPGQRVERKIGSRYVEFETVSLNDRRAGTFQGLINTLLPHGPRDVRLKQMLISVGATHTYILAKPVSQWCMNVEREHSGQQVYYIFDGRSIQQRCWSMKVDGDRKRGACVSSTAVAYFKERKAAVPKSAIASLFPHLTHTSGATFSLLSNTAQLSHHHGKSASPASRGAIPGNRHPNCSEEAIRAQTIAEIFRRDIMAAYPDLPKRSMVDERDEPRMLLHNDDDENEDE